MYTAAVGKQMQRNEIIANAEISVPIRMILSMLARILGSESCLRVLDLL
jgi:hypothetical protein